MKRLFKLLILFAIGAAIFYVARKFLAAPGEPSSGVLPTQPIKSLDEAPLGGQISPELLRILVCPEDKGPLELVDDGKFLLNPRNGYRYPIRNGIPVMLIEEGKKYRAADSAVNANGASA